MTGDIITCNVEQQESKSALLGIEKHHNHRIIHLPKMFRKRRQKETKLEDLSQHLIPIYNRAPCAFLIHNLFSSDECAHLIKLAEDTGFEYATVEGPKGNQIMRRDIRTCGRCMIDDVKLADSIYEKVMAAIRGTQPFEEKVMHAPWVSRARASAQNNMKENGRLTAVGLNERLRVMKYSKGHFFNTHQDIAYTRGPEFGERAGEKSHITVQIYLNDKFKGGTTRFVSGNRYYDVHPRKGSALVFDHNLLHQGAQVTKGIKYSVRTDIMFKREIVQSTQEMTGIATTLGVIPESAIENNDGNDEVLNLSQTPDDREVGTKSQEITPAD